MATPPSGTISVSQIDTEFKITNSPYGLDILGMAAFAKYSSPYNLTDFYNKSFAAGITTGLLIYLDAAHPDSGGGSTWYDRSGNGYNYSGGGTFGTGAYGGYYSFGGGSGKTGNGINVASTHTTEIWVRPQASQTMYGTLCSGTSKYSGLNGVGYAVKPFNMNDSGGAGTGIAVGTNGAQLIAHSADYIPILAQYSYSFSTSTFYQVVGVWSGNVPYLYINGTLYDSGCAANRTAYANMGEIGNADYGYYTGDMSIMRHWNRALSGSEITTLYNFTKTRYGL
jgi:hypothetical protein